MVFVFKLDQINLDLDKMDGVHDAKGKLLRVRWQRAHCALEEGLVCQLATSKGT